jgi:methyl-accepting chemotaxis protein
VNKLSLQVKLAGGFVALLLVLCVTALFAYYSINTLSAYSEDVEKQLGKTELSYAADDGYEMQTNGMRAYLLTGDEEALKHRQEGIDQAKESMDKLAALLQTPRGKEIYSRLMSDAEDLSKTQEEAIRLRRSGQTKAATDLIFGTHDRELRAEMDRGVEELQAITAKLGKDAQAAHDAAVARVRTSLLLLTVVGLLVGITVATLVVRSIRKSVFLMLSVIEEIANKNLTIADMHVANEDELGKAGLALNRMKNGLHDMIQSITDTAQHVATASEELSSTSQQISANSEETSAQANTVSDATKKVSHNLQSVSTGAEEMTTTIQSIASNAHEAATIASRAVQTAQAANGTVTKLGESSAEIGEVIKVITSIAQQTKLLALNATIEAARAGEAGKGFAVVANEVKELARQTAQATEDISHKITAIQTDTNGAVEAIGNISAVITQVNDISGTIATAVEQQSATTNEMTRNVADAAKGSTQITENIEGVAQAAQGTSTSAQESQKAANELADLAAQLRSLVEQFKIHQRDNNERLRNSTRESTRTMSAAAGR